MASTSSTPAEAASVPLQQQHQTCVLRVSIHCEGCKKKVKKILQKIPGVYNTEIDSKLHKVTVTGNVDGEALVRKLVKTGKYAELWPQQPGKEETQTYKDTPKAIHEEETKVKPQKKEAEQVKENITTATQDNSTEKSGEESKSDEKSAEKVPDGEANPPEKKESEGHGVAEEKSGGSGKGVKKKGKKGQKSKDVPATLPNNLSPPRQHAYQYPSYGHPPPPVYGVSYNTAHPTTTTSYYAPSTVSEPYTTYMHSGPPSDSYEMYNHGAVAEPYTYMHSGPPSDSYGMYNQGGYPPQSDSFEMFSEENANGCSIM